MKFYIWLLACTRASAQTCHVVKQAYQNTCCGANETTVLDVSGLLPIPMINYFKWFPTSMEPFFRAADEFVSSIPINVINDAPTGYVLDTTKITIVPPYYFRKSHPTFAPLTSYEPIGLRAQEYLDWYYDYNGSTLVDAVLDEYDLVGLLVGASTPQDYLYTVNPLTSINDLDGMNMRSVGIFKDFLLENGAVKNDTYAELYEYISPAFDSGYGWYSKFQYSYKISKEPRGNYFMLFPKAIWNLLPSTLQSSLRVLAKTATLNMLRNCNDFEAAYTGSIPPLQTLPSDIQISWDTFRARRLQEDMNSSWATDNYKSMINHMKTHKDSLP